MRPGSPSTQLERTSSTKWSGILLALAVFVFTLLAARKANKDVWDNVLDRHSDQWGYYQYLPALVGTHSMDLLPYSVPLVNDKNLVLFSTGVAWMQAPFFFASYVVAWITGADRDGYSSPFVWGQVIASASYAALGAWLVFLALRKRYGHAVGLLTSIVLLTCTNLHFYSVYDVGMSHVYAFFLMSAMLYTTVRMVERPSGGTLVALLAACALLVLVRHLHAIALLFPLLHGSTPREALRKRMGWLKEFPKATLIGLLIVLLLWVPQLAYWKNITGVWLVFSYATKGEGFDWSAPHLWDVLVSHQNGWFVYTPIMVIVMAYLLWSVLRKESGALLVLIVTALVWYTYASWWCWWLGGSFGHRGFVEYYALLALPTAGLLHMLQSRPMAVRVLSLSLLLILAVVNIRLSDQYQWPWEGPEWTWKKVIEVYDRVLYL
jgi:hypothetical protein